MNRLYYFLIIFTLFLFTNFKINASTDSSLEKAKKFAIELHKKGEYEKARRELNDIIVKWADHPNSLGLCYNLLGDIESRENMHSSAIAYFKKALKIYKDSGKDNIYGSCLNNIGKEYKRLGQYDFAINYLLEAIVVFEKEGMLSELSKATNVTANAYRDSDNLEFAIDYHTKALSIAIDLKDTLQIAKYLNNRADTYIEMEYFDVAIADLQNALLLKQKYASQESIANTLYYLGKAEALIGDLTNAEKHLQRSLQIRTEIDDRRGIAYSSCELGKLNAQLGNWNTAKTQLSKAGLLAQQMNVKELIRINELALSQLFEKQNQFEKALGYYKSHVQLNNIRLGKEKQKAINELEIKYAVEKRENENKLLVQENQIQALRIEKEEAEASAWKNNFIIVTIFSVLIFLSAIWLLQLFRREKSLKKRERQFAVEQHHRIKNNLQVLGGMLSFQHRKLEDLGAKEAIEESKNRIAVMTTLHQSLYNPKLSTKSKIKLNSYLDQIINNLQHVFSRKDVTINANLSPILIATDLALPIGLITNEIVSNALKYAKNKSEQLLLTIELAVKEKNVELLISDNGEWITPDRNNNSIGMELIQQLIKQIDGKKQINTSNGVSYAIEIPLR